MRIKKGDQARIITGKNKGKSGKVTRSFPAENKIIIEGLNLIKKHTRPKKEGEKGQRIELPGKIDISKVMFICPKCGKAARIGYKVSKADKIRLCRKCGAEI